MRREEEGRETRRRRRDTVARCGWATRPAGNLTVRRNAALYILMPCRANIGRDSSVRVNRGRKESRSEVKAERSRSARLTSPVAKTFDPSRVCAPLTHPRGLHSRPPNPLPSSMAFWDIGWSRRIARVLYMQSYLIFIIQPSTLRGKNRVHNGFDIRNGSLILATHSISIKTQLFLLFKNAIFIR